MLMVLGFLLNKTTSHHFINTCLNNLSSTIQPQPTYPQPMFQCNILQSVRLATPALFSNAKTANAMDIFHPTVGEIKTLCLSPPVTNQNSFIY